MKETSIFWLLLSILASSSQAYSSHASLEEGWRRVYLASYPRSGNHWVRYLVEESCHIATSSVYCDNDPPHLRKKFPWGGYCCDHGYEGQCRYPKKNECVLVKTHFPSQPTKYTPFDRLPYQKTILLVRHPVDSFYSRYVRQSGGRPLATVPTHKVREFIAAWKKFFAYWNRQKNVLLIRYEEMLNDPAPALRAILKALHYSFQEEDIERAILTFPPEGASLKHIDKFTQEDLQLIANELSLTMQQFGYTLDGAIFP